MAHARRAFRGPRHPPSSGDWPRACILKQVVRSVSNMTRAPARERHAKKGQKQMSGTTSYSSPHWRHFAASFVFGYVLEKLAGL